MESWSTHTPSPALKFENSPTESLLSTPGEMFPSLFASESSPASTTRPIDMLTPQSHADDVDEMKMLVGLTSALAEGQSPAPSSTTGTPEPEKKPVKKRKSWGQVLPEPKTNLPPRKRAKTEDEKEQRRVERVLRNRRAAQSSRERKRLEVEGLERRNKELEVALLKAQQTNNALLEQLKRFNAGTARSPSAFEGLTFSHELFSSQDAQANPTVDPSAISPTLSPIPEVDGEQTNATPVADSTPATVNASPDSTQHPAEMLSSDLQCQLAEASPSPWMELSQLQLHPSLPLLLQLQFLLASTSAMLSICQRPLMQIAMSLKAGFSLPPAPSLLTTIVWLVTSTRNGLNSTSTTSSTTATSMSQPITNSSRSSNPTVARSRTHPSLTLRHRLLRKILTCSPVLARPLMDATMEALRLASSKSHTVNRVGDGRVAAAAADGKTQQQHERDGRPAYWLPGAALPSKEVLLTLLWTLKVEERRLQIRQQAQSSQQQQPGSTCVSKTQPSIITITKKPYNNNSKRTLPEAEDRRQDLRDSKRRRF